MQNGKEDVAHGLDQWLPNWGLEKTFVRVNKSLQNDRHIAVKSLDNPKNSGPTAH